MKMLALIITALFIGVNIYAKPPKAPKGKKWVKIENMSDEFGYKDLIPLFKGEKFNADKWTDLFQKAGAQFAGSAGEHADGFSMWDSKVNPWNAVQMGP